MKIFSFSIPGNPVPKARARVTKKGAFTPQKTKNYESLVQMCFLSAVKANSFGSERVNIPAFEKVPLSIEIHFFLNMRKIDSRRHDGEDHSKKPDLTNLIKSIEDGLNGLMYQDDSQIASILAYKKYSRDPRVEVICSTL